MTRTYHISRTAYDMSLPDIVRQRRVLSKLLTDLKRLFPRALIRGHCEMPGAEPKACPYYKASREYRFIK